jgi:hypothetical protein
MAKQFQSFMKDLGQKIENSEGFLKDIGSKLEQSETFFKEIGQKIEAGAAAAVGVASATLSGGSGQPLLGMDGVLPPEELFTLPSVSGSIEDGLNEFEDFDKFAFGSVQPTLQDVKPSSANEAISVPNLLALSRAAAVRLFRKIPVVGNLRCLRAA